MNAGKLINTVIIICASSCLMGCSSVRQGIWEFTSFQDGELVKGTFEYKLTYIPVRYVSDNSPVETYAETTKGKGVLRVFLDQGKTEWFTQMYLDGKPDGLFVVWHPNGKLLRILIMREGEFIEHYSSLDRGGSSVISVNQRNFSTAGSYRNSIGTTSWWKEPGSPVPVSTNVVPTHHSAFP